MLVLALLVPQTTQQRNSHISQSRPSPGELRSARSPLDFHRARWTSENLRLVLSGCRSILQAILGSRCQTAAASPSLEPVSSTETLKVQPPEASQKKRLKWMDRELPSTDAANDLKVLNAWDQPERALVGVKTFKLVSEQMNSTPAIEPGLRGFRLLRFRLGSGLRPYCLECRSLTQFRQSRGSLDRCRKYFTSHGTFA